MKSLFYILLSSLILFPAFSFARQGVVVRDTVPSSTGRLGQRLEKVNPADTNGVKAYRENFCLGNCDSLINADLSQATKSLLSLEDPVVKLLVENYDPMKTTLAEQSLESSAPALAYAKALSKTEQWNEDVIKQLDLTIEAALNGANTPKEKNTLKEVAERCRG